MRGRLKRKSNNKQETTKSPLKGKETCEKESVSIHCRRYPVTQYKRRGNYSTAQTTQTESNRNKHKLPPTPVTGNTDKDENLELLCCVKVLTHPEGEVVGGVRIDDTEGSDGEARRMALSHVQKPLGHGEARGLVVHIPHLHLHRAGTWRRGEGRDKQDYSTDYFGGLYFSRLLSVCIWAQVSFLLFCQSVYLSLCLSICLYMF